MSLHPSHLPSLPSTASPALTASASAPPPQGVTSSRPKRRLSNATQLSMHDHDDDLALLDYDDEFEAGSATRSKRSRPGTGGVGAAGGGSGNSGSPKQGAGQGGVQVAKALTEKEKEARRVARMIRNRNAAQASRDRKKEHTAFLERRVADLEAQLRGKAVVPVSSSTASSSSSSLSSASASSSRLSRSQREGSVASSTSSSVSGRIADLEDENDGLRSQLHLEQVEKAHLRSRLDHLEDKLAQLAHIVEPSSSSPRLLFGGTSTPLPRFEPTFAFDTPNLSPLPQPEERAYLEAREREKQQRRVSGSALGLRTTPSPPASIADEEETMDIKDTTNPAPATEAVATAGGPGHRVLSSTVSPTPSPPSSIASVSPAASLPALLPPFGADDDDLFLSSSTPPAVPESYLELEPVDVSSVWTEWATGSLPAPTTAAGGAKPKGDAAADESSALAFLDLSFLQDAPMTA